MCIGHDQTLRRQHSLEGLRQLCEARSHSSATGEVIAIPSRHGAPSVSAVCERPTRIYGGVHSNRKGPAMHTRVVTFTGVKDFEGGIALVRDEVLPVLNEQTGYRGTTVSADRSGGVLGVLSLWDSAADREASFGALAKARQQGVEITGGEMAIESFEEMVVDISEIPAVGSALMVTRISMDPAKIDANLEFFKSEVLPRIKANSGYQAL